MDVFDVSWEGPIPFTKIVEGEGIPAFLKGPGIYIWTIQVKGRHVAYYVGETGRSIRNRTIEHYKAYVHGEYRIYDPSSFAQGEKVQPPRWGDAYGFRWPKRVEEFLRLAPKLIPVIAEFVGLFEVFVIPFGDPTRVRKRLEAEVHRLCEAADGDLQDKDIKYQPTNSGERPVIMRLPRPIPVAGLEGITEIELARTTLEIQ